MTKDISDKTVRNFKRIRIQLMRHNAFVELGPVMMVGKRVLDTSVRTACTNGRDEHYNPEFLFQWGDKEAGFIIMHENMHKAARHLEMYQPMYKKNARAANMACDEWINHTLTAADPNQEIIAMPRGENGKPVGCLTPKYKGWTVKKIFDDLMSSMEEEDGGDEGDGDGDGDGDRKGDRKGENKGKDNSGDGGGMDDHDWDGAKDMTEEEKEELKQEIEQALREGQIASRKIGLDRGASKLGIDELLLPKVNWREQLKEFVRSTCRNKEVSTWRKPNRRYLANNIVMPTLQGHSIKELVVAPDASGSMFWTNNGPTPFMACMSEVEGLAKQLQVDKLHLIYWDGWVTRHEEYTQATLANWRNTSQPSGGGGTDPSCVSTYLKEKGIKPDAVIVLTDGEVHGWGVWSCPVLWGIRNGKDKVITAPVGKTIRID